MHKSAFHLNTFSFPLLGRTSIPIPEPTFGINVDSVVGLATRC